jgi:hypothetical protein
MVTCGLPSLDFAFIFVRLMPIAFPARVSDIHLNVRFGPVTLFERWLAILIIGLAMSNT